MRRVRSLQRRVAALTGARAVSRVGAHRLRAPDTGERSTDRPQPPSSALEQARAAVAALLVDVERLRPGLVLHRSLDLDAGTGVRAQALCASFAECYAVCATQDAIDAAEAANDHTPRCRYVAAEGGEALAFPDEMFDLVHCGSLDGAGGADEPRLIGEALRVLRLHGVALVDLAGPPRPEPAWRDRVGALRLLVHLPGVGAPAAGAAAQIAVTITNAGDRVIGSALAHPRLECRWRRAGGAPEIARRAVLDGILVPGDSRLTTLPATLPASAGVHLLELSLVDEGPWGETRSPAATIAVPVGGSGQPEPGPAVDPLLPDIHRRVCAAIAHADGVMLGARTFDTTEDTEPWTRVFFAHA